MQGRLAAWPGGRRAVRAMLALAGLGAAFRAMEWSDALMARWGAPIVLAGQLCLALLAALVLARAIAAARRRLGRGAPADHADVKAGASEPFPKRGDLG